MYVCENASTVRKGRIPCLKKGMYAWQVRMRVMCIIFRQIGYVKSFVLLSSRIEEA